MTSFFNINLFLGSPGQVIYSGVGARLSPAASRSTSPQVSPAVSPTTDVS